MGLVSKDTAVKIAIAYQEIERGEGLLKDVREALDSRTKRGHGDKDTDLRDVFGRRQNSLQLGVPSGSNGHRLCDLSYDLAVPIIEAHIAQQKTQLAALSILAATELERQPTAPTCDDRSVVAQTQEVA